MKEEYYFKFEDLKIYQKAMDFGESVNVQIRSFPKVETFRLASQFIRAADSIALNVAEGYPSTEKKFNNYLQNAWDSLHECVSCSTKAKRRGFITIDEDNKNRKDLTELSKMISSYKKYLKTKIENKKQK